MSAKVIEMEPNGRVVIPRALRDALGIVGRGQFSVEIRDGAVVLTPVAVVPLDATFPITPQLAAAAGRAGAEPGPGLSRSQIRQRARRTD